MRKVVIVDYGMSNLGSVRRAFEECGAEARVSQDPKDLKSADHVVLPGVGAFFDGMAQLKNGGWIPALQDVVQDGVPLLGICLGMQLLAGKGWEGGEVSGLGFIPGEVVRLKPSDEATRIPHVGWNEIYHNGVGKSLFNDIEDGTDFYFVHSYHFVPEQAQHIASTTPYCDGFVSAVGSKNVFGVQFHPEKSSRPGFKLIRNFLEI